MKTAILLLSCSLLGACELMPKKADPPPVTPNSTQEVLIDRSLLESCDRPVPLVSREESVVVAWATDLLSRYKKCYERNEAHIQVLKSNFPQVKPKP